MHHEESYIDILNVNAKNEYVDTINVPHHTSVFYLFEVDDLPMFGSAVGSTSGGNTDDDWVFHCHIFQHGENSMISFLRVTQ